MIFLYAIGGVCLYFTMISLTQAFMEKAFDSDGTTDEEFIAVIAWPVFLLPMICYWFVTRPNRSERKHKKNVLAAKRKVEIAEIEAQALSIYEKANGID